MNNNVFKSFSGYDLSYVKIEGNAPYITYIHGSHSSKKASKSLFLMEFAKQNGLGFFSFDMTGHGESQGDYDNDGLISIWAQDVRSALSFLNQETVVVASSMGFWALSLAVPGFKSKIKGVVGVSVAPDFAMDIIGAWKQHPEIVTEDSESIKFHTEDGFEHKFMKSLLDDAIPNQVLNTVIDYSGPVTFLHGDNDKWISYKKAFAAKDALVSTDVKICVVKGAEHRFSEPSQLELIGQEIKNILSK